MNSPQHANYWIGRFIGDRQRYRLDRHLGKGGMGDVFLAMDTVLGKEVALKLLKGALTTTDEFKKRFEREVALCAALNNDHIVQVTDYGITLEAQPFYVMEYLQGETLGQRLAYKHQLTLSEALPIIIQVCLGLQTAHEGIPLWLDGATHREYIKVVHRDLKPDNIFLIQKGTGEIVKLLDFGIAKVFYEDPDDRTALSHANTFMGTPRYASPEQLGGSQEVDARSDIYSIGIILYEMLSGRNPYQENGQSLGSIFAWVAAHTTKMPQSLSTHPGCENIPPSIEGIVMKCLQKSPENRFDSVKALRQSLEQELSQLTIKAKSISYPAALELSIDSDDLDATLPPKHPPTPYPVTIAPNSLLGQQEVAPETLIVSQNLSQTRTLPIALRLPQSLGMGFVVVATILGGIFGLIHFFSPVKPPQRTSYPTKPLPTLQPNSNTIDVCGPTPGIFCPPKPQP